MQGDLLKQHQPVRLLRFGRRQLVSPSIFASYRLGDHPTAGLKSIPWELTNTAAVLVNAYDFTRRRFANRLAEDGWSLSTFLNSGDRPVLIDSGAYYFCKKDDMDVTPEEILDIQCKSGADVAVSLDHPFHPAAPDKHRRIDRTVRNTERMLRHAKASHRYIPLMPVVHGHTPQAIRGCLSRLQRCFSEEGFRMERLGIGSVAPLAQSGKAELAAEIIIEVRNHLPDTHIHCFSMGSALLMLLAFYCGADTVDSQSWIISAAFKYAQLPGHYVTRLARRDYSSYYHFKKARQAFAEKLRILSLEEGFFVRDWSSGELLELSSPAVREQYVSSLVDLKSNEHVHNRACHNLWVYNVEVQQARRAIVSGNFEHFVMKRLEGTRYRKAFLRAKALKASKSSFVVPRQNRDDRHWMLVPPPTPELPMTFKQR